MAKKCIYCKAQIDENSVLDVCARCGVGVWGEKMFREMTAQLQKCTDDGNFYQGFIGEQKNDKFSK